MDTSPTSQSVVTREMALNTKDPMPTDATDPNRNEPNVQFWPRRARLLLITKEELEVAMDRFRKVPRKNPAISFGRAATRRLPCTFASTGMEMDSIPWVASLLIMFIEPPTNTKAGK